MLQEYIDSPKRVPDSVLKYFGDGNRVEIVINECKEMVAFIDLALSKEGATINFS